MTASLLTAAWPVLPVLPAPGKTLRLPTGCTHLYLASADGFGWFNNSGSFEVSNGVLSPNGPAPVSSPATLGLTLAALALLGLGRRNPARRKGRAG